MKRGLFSTSILGDSQSPLLRSISVFSFSSPPGQWNTPLCLKKFKCTPVALQRLLSLWVKMAARAGTLYHCPYLLGRYSLRQVEADVKTRLTFYSTTTFVFKLVINISFRNGRYLLFEAQWGAVQKIKQFLSSGKFAMLNPKFLHQKKIIFFSDFWPKGSRPSCFWMFAKKRGVSRPIRNFLIR